MRHLDMDLLPTLPASNLCWLLVTLLTAGVPAHHPLIVQATVRLDGQQQADGRWISENGPSHDVHTTLEALRALQLSQTSRPVAH